MVGTITLGSDQIYEAIADYLRHNVDGMTFVDKSDVQFLDANYNPMPAPERIRITVSIKTKGGR